MPKIFRLFSTMLMIAILFSITACDNTESNQESTSEIDKMNELSQNYIEMSDFDAAIEYARKATELDPKNAAAWNNLGNAFLSKGDSDKAIEYLSKATELNPKFEVAWNNIGLAYNNKGDYDEAIKFYQKEWLSIILVWRMRTRETATRQLIFIARRLIFRQKRRAFGII